MAEVSQVQGVVDKQVSRFKCFLYFLPISFYCKEDLNNIRDKVWPESGLIKTCSVLLSDFNGES